MADVPLQVISDNAASERRITPSWTISQLRAKLEPITGIPPSSQRLSLKTSTGSGKIAIEAADEDNVQLFSFPLAPYAELHVSYSPSSVLFFRFHLSRDTAPVNKDEAFLLSNRCDQDVSVAFAWISRYSAPKGIWVTSFELHLACKFRAALAFECSKLPVFSCLPYRWLWWCRMQAVDWRGSREQEAGKQQK